MANFDEIDEARKLLGLGEAATLKEIRSVIGGWPLVITQISTQLVILLSTRKP